MNQAIHVAVGDYLIFLNCGDIFADRHVLEYLDNFILKNQDVDIIYGNYFSDGNINYQPSTLTTFYLFRTPLVNFVRLDMVLALERESII